MILPSDSCVTVATRAPASGWSSDILHESGIDPDSLGNCLRSRFDLYALEKRLTDSDKIQRANASILSDGTLLVEATPMEPVARVFEYGLPSYYINGKGKRISAELSPSL
mgnify:CR=1 FL=1